ncbi:MarR family winged helix-turn-helix transcriptional regulator [Pelobacter seleniigenes]|uniref:MarR family winged helix-turn-helix transcriptional regulator n=1 Tax=Pelobacter seleniigenes TaxID=407188 RepID=UPI0004A73901|nr:MarR family transcriptional regulator [Pelobacter seleniigenes]
MFDIVDLPDAAALARLAQRYPQLETPALQTWLGLMRVSDDCQNDLDRFLATHGLTQRKFFVLILLFRNPDGLLVSQLAKGTGVSCATMTGVVDGLHKAQLVTREPHEQDRRACTVSMTPSGQQLLDQVLPQHYRRVSRIMACLGPSERQQLQALLGKISASVQDLSSFHAEEGEPNESCHL